MYWLVDKILISVVVADAQIYFHSPGGSTVITDAWHCVL